MMPVATVMPDDTPMFDPSILHELDWSENTTTFSPAISPLEPGDGLVMRPLCTADVNRGFFKVLGQLTETGVVSPEQFIKTFEHMKRSGDYYVTVVEDTNLGQIVATATLVIEHKFTHSCAKGKERFDACPVLPPSELFSRSGRVLVEQMAADLAAGESQLGVNRELKREEG